MKPRKLLKTLTWLVLLSAFAVTSLLSLDNNSVYYYTPKELPALSPQKRAGKIRIGGMVKAASIAKDSSDALVHFVLTDSDGSELSVTYRGTPPDMFKENSGVIAEGLLSPTDPSAFTASKLLVKHSEEYKRPDIHPSMDAELVKDSLFGLEKDKS